MLDYYLVPTSEQLLLSANLKDEKNIVQLFHSPKQSYHLRFSWTWWAIRCFHFDAWDKKYYERIVAQVSS